MRDDSTHDPTADRLLERELVARSRELRALARHLVGDQDAEDVVQESMAIALRRPPQDRSGLSAWIRTVVRSVASNHHRSTRRRRVREIAAAKHELQASTESLAQQRETIQRLVTAVLALDEPYRETITLRYLQNLRPSQIAARTGVPLATVKSRLARGLARLRTELSERTPQWRSSLALALGLRVPGPGRPETISSGAARATTHGAFWMSKSTKTIAAVAPILIGALAFLFLQDTTPEVIRDGEAAWAAPRFEERSAPEEDDSPLQRQALNLDPIALQTDLEHPYEFTLECEVVDSNGYPIEGAQLAVAPPSCAWNTWPVPTDHYGSLTITWRGRSPRTSIAVGVLGDGGVMGPRLLTLVSDFPSVQTFLAKDLQFCAMAGQPSEMKCNSCHNVEESVLGTGKDSAPFRLHPDSTFSELKPRHGTNVAEDPRLAELPLEMTDPVPRIVGSARVGAFQTIKRRLARTAHQQGDETGLIEGRVYDSSGKPVAGALVTVGEEHTRSRSRTETSEDGWYRLSSVPIGSTEVRCVDPQRGAATATLSVEPGATTIADLDLTVGSEIRGKIAGLDPENDTGWKVVYDADDGSWSDAARVDSNRAFVLPNQPMVQGTLSLIRERGYGLPVAWIKGVVPDRPPVVFDLVNDPVRGSLRLSFPPLDSEAEIPRFEIRLWQLDTRRGSILANGTDGTVVIDQLPAGYYRLEYGAPSLGWASVESIWIDGENPSLLDRLTIPRPAKLEFPEGTGSNALIQLYTRTETGDRFVTQLVGQAERTLVLPAGRWLILGQGENGGVFSDELELSPGGTASWQRND